MTSGAKKNRTILGVGAPRPFGGRALVPVEEPPAEPQDEAPSEYEAWIGRVIDDRYEIEELLAEGGMGAVFVANHVKLGRRVAIKVMHPELEGNEEVVQRFAREVEVTGRLQHRHIVSALDCGSTSDGSVYLALELVTGRSLAEAIHEDGPFEWRRAATIAAQIADALAAAHREGIVHRDLKPDNIVLEDEDGDEIVKVLDFGIAHVTPKDGTRAPAEPLTRVGTVVGTVGYMAPEQCLGQPVDGRTDLYTLGVLLWEMLAGESLFDESLTLTSYVTNQLAVAPRPIADVVDGVPDELAALMDRLLAPKKAERADDAKDVRDELRALTWGAPAGSVVIDATSEPGHDGAEVPETGAPSSGAPSSGAPSSGAPSSGAPSSGSPSPGASGSTAENSAARVEPSRSSRSTRTGPSIGDRLAGAAGAITDAVHLLSPGARLVLVGGVAACVLLVIGVAVLVGDGDPPVKLERVAGPAPSAEVPEEELDDAPPDEVTGAVEAILAPDMDWRARHSAGQTILGQEPREAVPPFALALARLETIADCRLRVRAVRTLGESGDERALEPLRRYRRARRPRCGRGFVSEVDRATARIRRANRE